MRNQLIKKCNIHFREANRKTYEPGKSYNDYQKLSFRPTFGLPSNLSPESEVEELCGTDQEWAFDYILTNSSNFAAETLYITKIFNASIEATYESESLKCVHLFIWIFFLKRFGWFERVNWLK